MNQPAWSPRATDGDYVIFVEPWEARAFAIALALHEHGLYSWAEWTETLANRIKAAQDAGDSSTGDTYYRHWLGALEDLLAHKGISLAETSRWRAAWQHAATRTPHGVPIELQAEDFDTAPISGFHSR